MPTEVCHPATFEIRAEAVIPSTILIVPPARDKVVASTMNCVRMSRVFAPTACGVVQPMDVPQFDKLAWKRNNIVGLTMPREINVARS